MLQTSYKQNNAIRSCCREKHSAMMPSWSEMLHQKKTMIQRCCIRWKPWSKDAASEENCDPQMLQQKKTMIWDAASEVNHDQRCCNRRKPWSEMLQQKKIMIWDAASEENCDPQMLLHRTMIHRCCYIEPWSRSCNITIVMQRRDHST